MRRATKGLRQVGRSRGSDHRRRQRHPSGDIAEAAHCRAIIDRAVREFGRIDILVNNAAFQRTYENLVDIPDEEWSYTFCTNIEAMFHLAKAAVPHMGPGS